MLAYDNMITEVKDSLLKAYLGEIESYDEILDASQQVKPYWKKMFDTLEKLGMEQLVVRSQELTNKLRENGVTYNVYGSSEVSARPWQLDPIPFIGKVRVGFDIGRIKAKSSSVGFDAERYLWTSTFGKRGYLTS